MLAVSVSDDEADSDGVSEDDFERVSDSVWLSDTDCDSERDSVDDSESE